MIHFPFPSNMCFSKLIPLCLLLLLSLLLQQAAIGAGPLFHFCFILENYTSNDPFSSNLNELTTLLSSKVPPTGFGFASIGQGQDNVYGLALYWGDVSSTNLLFATGELVLEESMKLYGLAQCTRNLSSLDCKKCLDGAVSELPSCCNGKRGRRVVGGSCNVRYELYPFVNA
ncbi:Cysteine-rich repeat secretory protein 38 [Vitis vinifera]|uniref:Cysteine-rich repeat secretory protein 38 n=1 Tax=Vitis vinifera TaxID=29760 RepID=A0A438G885_VITVI|nr:Cysteine-rich repeat secretory protein 38 [Vitis vinifera]